VIPLEQLRERAGHVGMHRHAARPAGLRLAELLPVERMLDADHLAGEVAIAHAERQDLPTPQASERCGQDDRGVLLVGGLAHDRPQFFGVVEVEASRVLGREALDVVDGVRREAVCLAGALEDPVKDRDELGRGTPRQPSLGHLESAPFLDRPCRDVLELATAEGRDQVRVDGGPVVAHCRGLQVPLVLAVAKPLARSRLEADLLGDSELAPPDCDEPLFQVALGCLARVCVLPRTEALPMLLAVHAEGHDPRLAALGPSGD
jgi:hypothetical protein